jgi:hypothetical protein
MGLAAMKVDLRAGFSPPKRRSSASLLSLLDRATEGLPTTLLGKTLLEAALLTGLQVEAVFLDVLADAFPLDLSAKASHGLLKRLILPNVDEDQLELQVLDVW